MSEIKNSKIYDLEDRTQNYAKSVRDFVRGLPANFIDRNDIVQLVRSSGSVAANYIEANESLSKKDFYHRIKICRKEAKESRLWLKLLVEANKGHESVGLVLIDESSQLMKIFGAIIEKSKQF
ncbi:MAG: four helix bundle protein [Candidatus Buchananbacteria bacterium]|nr:four helix bundle protein [Candidatus Buchananbacteria bacterium]